MTTEKDEKETCSLLVENIEAMDEKNLMHICSSKNPFQALELRVLASFGFIVIYVYAKNSILYSLHCYGSI